MMKYHSATKGYKSSPAAKIEKGDVLRLGCVLCFTLDITSVSGSL